MSSETLKPGDVFDRYTIDGQLGEGGMGTVYSAFDPRLRRRVALKLLRSGAPGRGDSRGDAEHLLHEARAAAALDHPNAVAIYDVGAVDGMPYMAMELVFGRSLRHWIHDVPTPWRTLLAWLIDVARALEAAHQHGIVHRDVKPDNIFVRPDGIVKVLDFGIARVRSATEAPRPSRGTSGTPLYMAPEQMEGSVGDEKTDQFAWGVVTYEAITRHLPWEAGGDAYRVMGDILLKEPEPPSRVVSDVPSLVDATVLKTLAKAAVNRFASMTDVIAALEPYAATGAARDATRLASLPPSGPDASQAMNAPTLRATSAQTTEASVPEVARSAPSKPRTLRALWIVGPLATAGVLLGLLWPHRPNERPKPALLPAPVATTIVDLPPPVSANIEALAAYRGAMQAYRDGNLEPLIAGLKKATQLDPDMVAAHLRLGMFALFNNRATVARQSFAAASARRELLSEHDRSLLDALEPIAGEPPDLAEADRRLAALVASHPLDAESSFIFGNVLELRGSVDLAHDRFVRASELDPEWALADVMLGASVAYQGDLDAAEKILRSCSGTGATHVACAAGRARILKMLGRCSELEEEGRRIMAKDPDRTSGYLNVAQALASEHGATESVAEALRQRWARSSSVSRPRIELVDTLHLAILRGDFAAADRHAHDLDRLLADEPNVLDHGLPAREIAEIALETGKAADAARVAMRFLDRQSAWTPDLLHDDDTLFADVTVPMLAIAHHGGALRKTAFAERRDAWLADWKKQSAPLFVRYAWYQAYAAAATNADDAAEALAALPAYEPLPQFLVLSMPLAQTGKVYRLAGRFAESRALLEKGARVCAALDSPMLHVRAQLELGLAREGTGDAAAACVAYQLVLDRWGAAKPRSVTADAARARMRALQCPRR